MGYRGRINGNQVPHSHTVPGSEKSECSQVRPPYVPQEESLVLPHRGYTQQLSMPGEMVLKPGQCGLLTNPRHKGFQALSADLSQLRQPLPLKLLSIQFVSPTEKMQGCVTYQPGRSADLLGPE